MPLTIPSFDDLYEAAKAELLARTQRLRDFSPGSGLDATAGLSAILADQVIRYAARRFDALFIDRARGQDLDTLIEDRWPLSRHPALPSRVTVSVPRGGLEGDVVIHEDAVFRAQAADGTTFEFSPPQTQTLTESSSPTFIVFELLCTSEGRATNLPSDGTTWEVVGLGDGTDISSATLTTQSPGFVEGADVESDDAFRTRAKLYDATLVRATMEALLTGALSVPEVRLASVVEVALPVYSPLATFGILAPRVYVGDTEGQGTTPMVAAVFAELRHWRAAGVNVTVLPATIEWVTGLVISGVVAANANEAAIRAAWRSRVAGYFDELPPGRKVFLDAIAHELHTLTDEALSVRVFLQADPTALEIEPGEPTRSLRISTEQITVTLTEGGS